MLLAPQGKKEQIEIEKEVVRIKMGMKAVGAGQRV